MTNPNPNLDEIYHHFIGRQPLMILSTLPIYHLVGLGFNHILWLNLIFSNLLLISIYYLTAFLKHKTAGILACSFLLATPAFLGSVNTYLEEFIITPFIILFIYFIYKSDFFKNFKEVILVGFVLTVGILYKLTIILYILGPFLSFLYFERKKINRERLANLSLLILLPLSIFLLIYSPILGQLYKRESRSLALENSLYRKLAGSSGQEGINFLFTEENLTFQIDSLLRELEITGFIVFSIGLIFFLRGKINYKKISLLSGILFPISFFTFITFKNKTLDSMVPIIPLISLIFGTGIAEIKNKKILYSLICIFLIVFSFQFYAIRYDKSDYDILFYDYDRSPHSRNGYKTFGAKRTIPDVEYRYGDSLERLKSLEKYKQKLVLCRCIELDDILFYNAANLFYKNGVKEIIISENMNDKHNLTSFDYIFYEKNVTNCPKNLENADNFEIIYKGNLIGKEIFILKRKNQH